MTFEQAIEKYLEEHGDFGTAMHFGQAMYEAGKAASRRPIAVARRVANSWAVVQEKDDANSYLHIRGGFSTCLEAEEWATSNGYEV